MRFFVAALAVIVAVSFCGCAGYSLGPTNGLDAGLKTVRIEPFQNQTLEPRLGDEVTSAIRNRVQRDGTYHLSTQGEADIVVTGTVTRYDRHELSLLPNDVLTARDYRVNATAHVTARAMSSGKVIFDGPVTGYTLIRVGSDLTSSERQALPLLADEMAKNVTAMLVDGSW